MQKKIIIIMLFMILFAVPSYCEVGDYGEYEQYGFNIVSAETADYYLSKVENLKYKYFVISPTSYSASSGGEGFQYYAFSTDTPLDVVKYYSSNQVSLQIPEGTTVSKYSSLGNTYIKETYSYRGVAATIYALPNYGFYTNTTIEERDSTADSKPFFQLPRFQLTGKMVQPVLTETMTLLPYLMICIIGFLTLRKVWQIFHQQLRKA